MGAGGGGVQEGGRGGGGVREGLGLEMDVSDTQSRLAVGWLHVGIYWCWKDERLYCTKQSADFTFNLCVQLKAA